MTVPSGGVTADDDKCHQHIKRHDDGQGQEYGAGDIPARVTHFLTRLHDDLIAFEGDESQAHRADDADDAFRREVVELLEVDRLAEDDEQTADDEDQDDDDFEHGDDIADCSRLRCAAIVDIQKEQDDEYGKDLRHQFGFGQFNAEGQENRTGEEEVGMLAMAGIGIAKQDAQQFVDKAAEADAVEAARHRMGEPAHPTGQKTVWSRQAFLHPQVAAAGFRYGRAELRVDHGGENGDDAVQGESEYQSRTGDTGGDAGQDEDAGADHRADPDHGDVEQSQIANQSDVL